MSKARQSAIYPLFSLLGVLVIIIFSLVMAKNSGLIVSLLFMTIVLAFFGCGKQLVRLALPFFVVAVIFCYITYASSGGDMSATLAMEYRFWGLFLASALGSSCSAVAMTRCLSTLGIPRGITLGMLVVWSFVPLLGLEMKRIAEAMRTRGVGSALTPRVASRSFLIPRSPQGGALSDPRARSGEPRGFTLGDTPYTVYKPVKPGFKDYIFLILLICGVVLLWV